jgi:hypothetical protein
MLNVSTKTVQSWEQGQRRPSQAALRLIQVFRQDPSGLLEVVGMSPLVAPARARKAISIRRKTTRP